MVEFVQTGQFVSIMNSHYRETNRRLWHKKLFFSPAELVSCSSRHVRSKAPLEISTLMRYWPRHITRRITAQRGLFIVHPHPSEALDMSNSGHIRMHRAIVESSFKKKLRWNLSRFGVHQASLFPDVDGLAAHIT